MTTLGEQHHAVEDSRRARRPRRGWLGAALWPFRWIIRLLVLVIILLLVVAAVVLIVLNTDLPRTTAIDQAQKQTGLRIEIGDADVGIFGTTVLTDVRVSLPLEDEPFATIDRLVVKHTPLPMIAIQLGVTPDGITTEGLQVHARQNAQGVWNLVRAVEIVQTAQDRGPSQPSSGPPSIPEIDVPDARITVNPNDGRKLALDPLIVAGRPVNDVSYRLRVELPAGADTAASEGAPPHVLIEAAVALNKSFQHEVQFAFNQLAPLAAPLIELPSPLQASGRLIGQTAGGGYTGRLELQGASFGPRRIGNGELRLNVGGGKAGGENGTASLAVVQVINLLVEETGLPAPRRVTLTGGRVAYEQDRIVLQDVRGETLQGRFRLDGGMNPQTLAADLQARFARLNYNGVVANGELSARYAPTFEPGGRADVTLVTQGTAPVLGSFSGRVDVVASGPMVNSFDYSFTASDVMVRQPEESEAALFPPIRATGRMRTNVERPADEAAGQTALTSTTFYLDRLQSLDGGNIRAQGSVTQYPAAMEDLPSLRGYLFAEAEEVPIDLPQFVPILAEGGVDLAFADDYFQLRNLYVNAGDLSFGGSGYYNFAEKPENDPLEAYLYLNHVARPVEEEALPATGVFRSQLTVRGVADPRDLEQLALAIEGEAIAEDFRVGDYNVGNLRAELRGSANEQRLRLATTGVQFLQTAWDLQATYPFSEREPITFNLAFDALPLPELAAFLPQLPPLNGLARMNLDVQSLGLNVDNLQAKGQLFIDEFAIDIPAAPVRADTVDVPLNMTGPMLSLGPVVATQGQGVAEVTASLNINDPDVISLGLDINQYPLSVQEELMQVILNAQSQGLRINLADPRYAGQFSVDGQVALGGTVALGGEQAGTYKAQVKAVGREVRADDILAEVIGGQIEGFFVYDLSNPEATQARLFGEGLQGAEVAKRLEQGAQLKGTYAFELMVDRSQDRRAQGPVRIDFNFFPSVDAAFGEIAIGDIDLTAYLAFTEDNALERFVTQDVLIRVASGVVNPFLRVSRQQRDVRLPTGGYESVGVLDTLVDVNFSNLDLNQIVRTVDPETTNVQGDIQGNINTFGLFEDLANLKGRGRIEILDAALADLGFVEQITERQDRPGGEGFAGREESGTLNFQLESGRLDLNNIYLFANNAEIRARATVADIGQLPESPLDGFAVVTFRPLKNVRLPFLGGATDELLTAIQKGTGATAFKLDGTVENYRVTPAPLSEVGNAVQGLLLQDAREAQE